MAVDDCALHVILCMRMVWCHPRAFDSNFEKHTPVVLPIFPLAGSIAVLSDATLGAPEEFLCTLGDVQAALASLDGMQEKGRADRHGGQRQEEGARKKEENGKFEKVIRLRLI